MPPPLRGRVVAAALVAGLLGAVAVEGEQIGLGVVLCGLAAGAAGRLGRARLDGWSCVHAALAVALLLVALLRDAAWVVVPTVFASAAFASLAFAGGRSWAGVAAGLGRVAPQLAPGTAALAQALVRRIPVGRGAAPALRGAGIAAILLSVFGVLFASGDAAFAHLAGEALPSADSLGALPVQTFWFLAAAAVAAALATVRPAREGEAEAAHTPDDRPATGLRPAEWGIALGALVALFAAFVAVQATVLFGKDEHVLDTAGLTYAAYAREGFVQLLVASALTLAVLAAALHWARTETRSQRLVLRALLGGLGLLTLVVLASAAHRLDLYEDAFGATRARLAAGAIIAWLGVLLWLVLVGIGSNRFRWLPRACALVTGLAFLGFGLSNPDGRIAERNIERLARTGDVDRHYLGTLSADAVPALAKAPRELRGEALHDQARRLEADEGWGGLNRSRERARDVLAGIEPRP
jgi:hypothetical protein